MQIEEGWKTRVCTKDRYFMLHLVRVRNENYVINANHVEFVRFSAENK